MNRKVQQITLYIVVRSVGKVVFLFIPDEYVCCYNHFGSQFVNISQNCSAYKLAYMHKAVCARLLTKTVTY